MPLPKLPSIVWIIILALGLIALIGGIIGSFWALATIEGVASLALLLIAWFIIRSGAGDKNLKLDPLVTAIAILFFALMGMSVDQSGNWLYNKPMELIFCSANQHLTHQTSYSNPLPGTTYITDEFHCTDNQTGKHLRTINTLERLVFRFVEYLALGYLLIFISKILDRFPKPGQTHIIQK